MSLAATTVYSHPTLARFAAFVLSRLGHRQPARGVDAGAGGGNADQLRRWLRETLALELAITGDALDDDTKFVDLGLDSITAVTWIRAINRQYGLSVAATKVYSHPTLSELGRYLSDLMRQQDVFAIPVQPEGGSPRAPALAAAEMPVRPASQPVPVHSFYMASTVQRRSEERRVGKACVGR